MSARSIALFILVLVSFACCSSAPALGGEEPLGEDFKLIASDGTADDQFGFAVAIDGDLAVVGARRDSGEADRAGAAYVYRWIPALGNWIEEQKLVASDAAAADQYGFSVAIQGERIVVGSVSEEHGTGANAGAVYLYLYDADEEEWVEEQILYADDDDAGDAFGASVSIDGDVLAVGADQDDEGAPPTGVNAGAAYVFRYDDTALPGEGWEQEAKLLASDSDAGDVFARAVVVQGDLILVGARQDDDDGANSGSAYVFRDLGAGDWFEEAKLVAGDGAAGDNFGISLDVDGDVAVVGSRHSDTAATDAGAAYVFRYDPDTTVWLEEQVLYADDADDVDRFGRGVFIEGERIVVGAPGDDEVATGSGAAYLFEYDSEVDEDPWSQISKLAASDDSPTAALGFAVAVSGSWLIVSARLDDDLGDNAGAAYLFSLFPDCNGNLVEDSIDIEDGTSEDCNDDGIPDECQIVGASLAVELSASDGADGDEFGAALDWSRDRIIIGAAKDSDVATRSGSALVYHRDGDKWLEYQLNTSDASARDEFGGAVAISGHRAIVGASRDNHPDLTDAGSAYVFEWDADDEEWRETETLIASDPLANDQFGVSVDIDGRLAVVGAHRHDPLDDSGEELSQAGTAYVFRFDGTTWIEEARLVASDATAADNFGISVSVSGDVILIGAHRDDEGADGAGAAYVFRHDGSEWTEEQKLVASDASEDAQFGLAVQVDGDRAIVGAPLESAFLTEAGAAYLFRHDGESWSEEQILTEPVREERTRFGSAVALGGDVAVVGAPSSSAGGAAYAYAYDGEEWSLWRQLPTRAGADSEVGSAVALSGPRALVGVPGYAVDDGNPGGAFAFVIDDCNDNGIPDGCDIADGTSEDCNENGIPDECEDVGPTLVLEPATQALCFGDELALEVVALGAGDLTYQWQLDGDDIVSATAPTLNLGAFGEQHVGTFTVVVADDCGEVTSREAEISVGDDCGGQFIRGDVNGNGSLSVADGIGVLRFIFVEDFPIGCEEAADANNSDSLTLTDGLLILNFVFVKKSPAPTLPYPDCGTDDTSILGCEEHEFCNP